MRWRLVIDSSESPTGLTMSVLGMDITHADLVRLVVGMQWVDAMRYHVTVDGQGGGWLSPFSWTWGTYRPASDIVDEWLGVR